MRRVNKQGLKCAAIPRYVNFTQKTLFCDMLLGFQSLLVAPGYFLQQCAYFNDVFNWHELSRKRFRASSHYSHHYFLFSLLSSLSLPPLLLYQKELTYTPAILYVTIINKKIKIPTENGRRPHTKWKTISSKMEDDLTQNGRRPHPKWKRWRQPKMKTTKNEDDQKWRRPKMKTTKN